MLQTLSGICGKVMGLIGVINPKTFTNMVLTRDCLGTILGNVGPGTKTLSGIYGKVMVLLGDVIFATFTSVVWQGIVLWTILKNEAIAKPYQE